MIGAFCLSLAAYEWVKWRAKSASGWKVILWLASGLVLLTRDIMNAPHVWPFLLAATLCAAAGYWTARRGISTGLWKVVLGVVLVVTLIDIAAEGGPLPWWKALTTVAIQPSGR